MIQNLTIFGIILFVIGLFIFGPWLSIMVVNQLFGTSIPFNFVNWLSVIWLHIVCKSATGKSS